MDRTNVFVVAGTSFSGIFTAIIRIICTLVFYKSVNKKLYSVFGFFALCLSFLIFSFYISSFLLNEFEKQCNESVFIELNQILNNEGDKPEIKIQKSSFKVIFERIFILSLIPFLNAVIHYSIYPGYLLKIDFKIISSTTWKNIFVCSFVSVIDFCFRFLSAIVMCVNDYTIWIIMLMRIILMINILNLPFVNSEYFSLFNSDFFKIISIFLFIASFGYPIVASLILMNQKKFEFQKDIDTVNNIYVWALSIGGLSSGLIGTFILSKIN